MNEALREDIGQRLQALAERFYARDGIQYTVSVSPVSPDSVLVEQNLYAENSKPLEESVITARLNDAYTCAKAALEAMIRRAGLIAPLDGPHRVKFVGDTPANSHISIDGQVLQSLYSAKFSVDVESEYKVELGLIAPFVHLDVDVLPKNLTLTVEGLSQCIDCMERINAYRNTRFSDIEYAQAHSSDEETQLYKELNALLLRFKASQ